MFGPSWRLMRVGGVSIYIDASWLIVLALLTWTLSARFQEAAPDLTMTAYWLLGLVTALAFFVCIVLHELGHALTAQRLGIPMRRITLFLFGGVAEMTRQPPSAGKEFLVAVAGPIVSVALGALFGGLAVLGASLAWPPAATVLLRHLALINIVVLVFNLVPAFPLDGGRVLRAALWGAMGNLKRATFWASLAGRGFAWFLIGMGILAMIQGLFIDGLWLALIGIFLHSAASSGYQQVLIRQALQGEPISRFMNPNPIVAPPSLDMREWVDNYVYRYHHKAFPVASNGHVEGIISTQVLDRIPRGDWAEHSVGEMMNTDVDAISLPPQADALAALERMHRSGASRLLVIDKQQLVGIVALRDLMRFLELKLELERDGDDDDSMAPPAVAPPREYVER